MDIESILITPLVTIKDAVEKIETAHKAVAIVVDDGRRLLGLITDGDVRRAILDDVDLALPVSTLLERRAQRFNQEPISAPTTSTRAERIALMRRHTIRHLPIVRQNGVVVELETIDDILAGSSDDLTAVVMAGGFGTRLRPLTTHLPKPMLPLDGKPLLEHQVEQLRLAGIRKVRFTTHYRREQIADYFRDGTDFGVEIEYLEESHPLGTAGALGLVDEPPGPLLVINGDILTSADFGAMLAFHHEHHADMTVAVRQIVERLPYGIVEVDGVRLTRIDEKPRRRHLVNAGLYVIGPHALNLVPRDGSRFDMPDLIGTLAESGHRVVTFPIHEYWRDIGQPADYARAQADVQQGVLRRVA